MHIQEMSEELQSCNNTKCHMMGHQHGVHSQCKYVTGQSSDESEVTYNK